MATIVTVQVLKGLLSPDAGLRSAASKLLSRLSAEDKCQQLLQLLPSLDMDGRAAPEIAASHGGAPSSRNAADSAAAIEPLRQLIFVLLRREVLKVTSVVSLSGLVEPLLEVFTRCVGSSRNRGRTAALVGECLASVVQGLEQLEHLGSPGEPRENGTSGESAAAAALQRVLAVIANPVSYGQLDCLGLLAEVARTSHKTFCRLALPSLPDLVGAALRNGSDPNATDEDRMIQRLASLVVHACVAAETVASPSRTTIPPLLPLPQAGLPSDGRSVCVQLGESCWLPILRHVAIHLETPKNAITLHGLREPFLLAAEAVPSLLFGNTVLPASLEFLNRAIQNMSAAMGPGDVPGVLPAVLIVATLLDGRPELRQRVVSDSSGCATASNELLEACLVSCLRTMALCKACSSSGMLDGAEIEDDDVLLGDDDDDILDSAAYAETLLETLVRSLGAPAVQVVLANISSQQQHLTQADSPSPRWCLAALRCCAVAAPMSLAPHARVAVEWALSAAGSSSATTSTSTGGDGSAVMCEAVVLIGSLVEQYPEIRDEYAARILTSFHSTLVEALPLVSTPHPTAPAHASRVCICTCRALVSFCRGSSEGVDQGLVDPQRVLPHLSFLLPALILLLQQPATRTALRASIVSAVACLATVAGPDFCGYYPSVMPVLLQTIVRPYQLSNTSSPGSSFSISELRGAALESATVIGQAIDDAELFEGDAIQLLQFATDQLQQSTKAKDSYVPREALLSACARIASVIKEEYAPYANIVVSHLLQRATDPSDIEISDACDTGSDPEMNGDDDGASESMTVAIPGRGLTKVTIHTSEIQGKVQAIRALYEHAVALGPLYSPWCQRSFDALGGMVHFAYSADLRGSVAQTLSVVFEAACLHGVEVESMETSNRYLSPLLLSLSKQMASEDTALDVETLHAEADAVSDILLAVYQNLEEYGDQLLARYNLNDARLVVQHCMACLVSCLERRNKIATARFGGNGVQPTEDEVRVYEQMLGREEVLLTPLVDSVGYNLKFFRHSFVSVFEDLVAPVLAPYLATGVDIRARVAAICLYDDCVEHCGTQAAAKYAPILASGAMSGLDDATMDQDLLRASIYGVAQICRYAPSSVLLPYEDRIMLRLCSIIRDVKTEENEAVYENAVSALASLTLFGSSPISKSRVVSGDDILPIFLRSLPLTVDYDESKFCNAGLCDLVDKGAIPMNASTCLELLRIFGESLAMVEDGEVVATGETCLRFAALIFRMQQEVPREFLQNYFAALSPGAQAAVQKAIGQYAPHLGAVVTP